MKLGKNEELILEVKKFFNALSVSQSFKNSDEADCNDIDLAARYAFEYVYGEDEFTYPDIKSLEMRSVWAQVYSDEGFKNLEDNVKKLIDELSLNLAKKLRSSQIEAIGEEVIADMQNIIYSRAVFGKENSFWESLFQTYQSGLLPCGWKGEYPKGSLTTFAIA